MQDIENTPQLIRTTQQRVPSSRTFAELLILLFLYIALCPLVSMQAYNRLLLFPIKGNYDDTTSAQVRQIKKAEGVVGSKVSFAGQGGKRLCGWFFKRPNERRVILVSHGNGGN